MGAKEWTDKTQFPAAALDDMRLSNCGFRVLALLGNYQWGPGGYAEELQVYMAKRLGVTQQYISKGIRELLEYGYIKVHYERVVGSGCRHRAKYRIVYDREVPKEFWRFVPERTPLVGTEAKGYVPVSESDPDISLPQADLPFILLDSHTTEPVVSHTTQPVVSITNKGYAVSSNELTDKNKSTEKDDVLPEGGKAIRPRSPRKMVNSPEFHPKVDGAPEIPKIPRRPRTAAVNAPAAAVVAVQANLPLAPTAASKTKEPAKAPAQRGRPPKPSADGRAPQQWVDEFCAAVYTSRGLRYPVNFTSQVARLHQLRTRYSLESVLAYWQHLKAQPRWQKSDIPYSFLINGMEEWESQHAEHRTSSTVATPADSFSEPDFVDYNNPEDFDRLLKMWRGGLANKEASE